MKKDLCFIGLLAWSAACMIISLACGGGGSGGFEEVAVVEETDGARSAADVLNLPAEGHDYESYAIHNLPAHFLTALDGFSDVMETDNTPDDNPLSNQGATLGRVLFYDRELSRNRRVSCASCHSQNTGFSDRDRFSRGFDGGRTARHSPGLSNAKFYERARFFWDERAETLEEQVLMPIQDPVEMGMDLDVLVERLSALDYYAPLFVDAFGTAEVTSERIAKALAQFVRSMVSYQSRFDRAIVDGVDSETFNNTLNDSERLGFRLFNGEPGASGKAMRCNACHTTSAFVSQNIENIGLDADPEDEGAGDGKFKAPSLRNIAARGPFMHDGRFRRLSEVMEHYNSGIQDHEGLNRFLRDEDGEPLRLEWTDEERRAVVDFLRTLTDDNFLNNPMFSNPFRERNGNGRGPDGRGGRGGQRGPGNGPPPGGGPNGGNGGPPQGPPPNGNGGPNGPPPPNVQN